MKTNVRQKVDFNGRNIHVGMDVHRKQWNISIFADSAYIRTFQQPPQAEILIEHLRREYPGANYKLAYEAGFCGFGICRKLKEAAMDCIVVHAADVPHTHKSTVTKTDSRDSRQIGEALSGGMLKAIHVPDLELEGDRHLARYRGQLLRDQRRCKVRIKSLLHYSGIVIPSRFDNGNWSRVYVNWLENLPINNPYTKQTLALMIDQVKTIRTKQLDIMKYLRELCKTDRYAPHFKLLTSIPGIGPITAITLLTEIGDINRFKSFERFNSFIGFCPSEFSTGEKIRKGGITSRHHSPLREMIIEAAWVAIKHDAALALTYDQWKKQSTSKRAIIKTARKLLNRLFMVWKKQTMYEPGIVQ